MLADISTLDRDATTHTIGTAVEAAYRRGDLFEKRRHLAQIAAEANFELARVRAAFEAAVARTRQHDGVQHNEPSEAGKGLGLLKEAAPTELRTLAAAIKPRWICEEAHQQMKEELGLDHFEGRSWQGLHREASTRPP